MQSWNGAKSRETHAEGERRRENPKCFQQELSEPTNRPLQRQQWRDGEGGRSKPSSLVQVAGCEHGVCVRVCAMSASGALKRVTEDANVSFSLRLVLPDHRGEHAPLQLSCSCVRVRVCVCTSVISTECQLQHIFLSSWLHNSSNYCIFVPSDVTFISCQIHRFGSPAKTET